MDLTYWHQIPYSSGIESKIESAANRKFECKNSKIRRKYRHILLKTRSVTLEADLKKPPPRVKLVEDNKHEDELPRHLRDLTDSARQHNNVLRNWDEYLPMTDEQLRILKGLPVPAEVVKFEEDIKKKELKLQKNPESFKQKTIKEFFKPH